MTKVICKIVELVLLQRALGAAAFDIPAPWCLAEENMLLDAVEQYGFGNWSALKIDF